MHFRRLRSLHHHRNVIYQMQPHKLTDAVSSSIAELQSFAETQSFQNTLHEMWELPARLRHEFVELVWLNPAQLAYRGVETPRSIIIQRSEFGDKRPTLFCISKELPSGLG